MENVHPPSVMETIGAAATSAPAALDDVLRSSSRPRPASTAPWPDQPGPSRNWRRSDLEGSSAATRRQPAAEGVGARRRQRRSPSIPNRRPMGTSSQAASPRTPTKTTTTTPLKPRPSVPDPVAVRGICGATHTKAMEPAPCLPQLPPLPTQGLGSPVRPRETHPKSITGNLKVTLE